MRLLGSSGNVPPSPPSPNPLPRYAPFGFPYIDSYRLGQCHKGTGQPGLGSPGQDCGGQTAANAFCALKGYSSALNFRTEPVMMPTKAIGDGEICKFDPARPYLRCFAFAGIKAGRRQSVGSSATACVQD